MSSYMAGHGRALAGRAHTFNVDEVNERIASKVLKCGPCICIKCRGTRLLVLPDVIVEKTKVQRRGDIKACRTSTTEVDVKGYEACLQGPKAVDGDVCAAAANRRDIVLD